MIQILHYIVVPYVVSLALAAVIGIAIGLFARLIGWWERLEVDERKIRILKGILKVWKGAGRACGIVKHADDSNSEPHCGGASPVSVPTTPPAVSPRDRRRNR
jgi:hypothetical protein